MCSNVADKQLIFYNLPEEQLTWSTLFIKTADFFTSPQKQLIFPFLILEQLIFNAEEQLIVFLVSQLVTECQFDGIAKYCRL